MDVMGEAAEVQPAKRARSDSHADGACSAVCDIVIINKQDFQGRKSDLQTLLRQVNPQIHRKRRQCSQKPPASDQRHKHHNDCLWWCKSQQADEPACEGHVLKHSVRPCRAENA